MPPDPNSSPSSMDHVGRRPVAAERSFWTVPNILCAIRLAASPSLLACAWFDEAGAFLAFFLFLALTDWADGKLAIWLNQRSVFGARLDSAADAIFYGATLLGLLYLRWDTLVAEIAWLVFPVLAYAVSSSVGLWRFGRWPSYHTRGAKTSWLLALITTVSALLDWSIWPLRFTAVFVTLTNLEAILISFVLPHWEADVPSLYHAWRIAGRERAVRTDDADVSAHRERGG